MIHARKPNKAAFATYCARIAAALVERILSRLVSTDQNTSEDVADQNPRIDLHLSSEAGFEPLVTNASLAKGTRKAMGSKAFALGFELKLGILLRPEVEKTISN